MKSTHAICLLGVLLSLNQAAAQQTGHMAALPPPRFEVTTDGKIKLVEAPDIITGAELLPLVEAREVLPSETRNEVRAPVAQIYHGRLLRTTPAGLNVRQESISSDRLIFMQAALSKPSVKLPVSLTSTSNLTFDTQFSFNNNYNYFSFNHELTLSAKVKNDGTTDAGAFRVSFYLSQDTVITTSDFRVAGFTEPGLQAGKTMIAQKNMRVNLDTLSLAAGTYYVGTIIDDLFQIEETNEEDNIVRFASSFYYAGTTPNLIVDTAAGSLNSYNYFSNTHVLSITATIKNGGGGNTGNFRVGYYLSDDSVITTSDRLISAALQTSLGENSRTFKFQNVDLDTVAGLSPGQYYLGVYLDNSNEVVEFNETDNTNFFTPELSLLPNLTLDQLSPANRYSYDQNSHELVATTVIKNVDFVPAGGFRVTYHLSDDRTISSDDFLLRTETLGKLAANTSDTVSFTIDLDDYPALSPGTYYLGWIIDDLNQVAESNESDNIWYFNTAFQFGSGPTNERKYTVQLLPGQSFDGWWYFWTTGAPISADYEVPAADWLTVSPTTFTSNSCSEPVAMRFQFKGLSQADTVTLSMRDRNNRYPTMVVTMEVTERPTQFVSSVPVRLAYGSFDILSLTAEWNGFTNIGCQAPYLPDSASTFKAVLQHQVDWLDILPDSVDVKYQEPESILHLIRVLTTTSDSVYEMITRRFYSYPSYFAWKLEVTTSVAEHADKGLPETIELFENYPNPFNPGTTIAFALPRPEHVVLKIYSMLGEEIATLVDEKRAAGIHKAYWQPNNLPSGVYFYRLQAGEFVQTRKLALVR